MSIHIEGQDILLNMREPTPAEEAEYERLYGESFR